MSISVNINTEQQDKTIVIREEIDNELKEFSAYFVECKVPPPTKFELAFLQNYLLWKLTK
jgi:hypothetical protein